MVPLALAGLGDIIAKISDTLDPVSYSHGPELNWQPWSDQVTLSERAAALKAKRSHILYIGGGMQNYNRPCALGWMPVGVECRTAGVSQRLTRSSCMSAVSRYRHFLRGRALCVLAVVVCVSAAERAPVPTLPESFFNAVDGEGSYEFLVRNIRAELAVIPGYQVEIDLRGTGCES